MVEPYFTMLWATDIPVVEFDGRQRHGRRRWRSATPSRRRLRRTRGQRATTPRWRSGCCGSTPARRGRCRRRAIPMWRARCTSSRATRCRSASTSSPRRPAPSCDSETEVEVRAGDTADRMPDPARPPDRRAGRPIRTVRDEHPRRDRAGVRRLPADRLRWLAVGRRRSRARRRSGSLRPPSQRVGRATRMTSPTVTPDIRQRSDAGHHRAGARAPGRSTRVPATFFAIGRKLATPDGQRLGRRIVATGHRLGGHTWSHSVQFGVADDAVITDELARTRVGSRRRRRRRAAVPPVRRRWSDRRSTDEPVRRVDAALARVHVRAVERAARRLARSGRMGRSWH